MKKPEREARREVNRQLAARDAANRCARCKRALVKGEKVYLVWGEVHKYCSPECRDDA